MPDPISFNARAVFTFSPDRIYRVESRNGCLYFLRIGGQFDTGRLGPPPGGALLPAVMDCASSRFVDPRAGGKPRSRGQCFAECDRALAAEITPSLAAQLIIDQGHQGVERLVIAVSPIYEQLCYLAGRKSVHIDPGAVGGDARLIA